MRKYKAIARLQARVPPDEHEDDALTAAHSMDAPLNAALAALKHGDRDVLLLVALGDLSYAEVAQALGIAYGTVCSRLNRARRQVKTALSATAIASPDEGEIHA